MHLLPREATIAILDGMPYTLFGMGEVIVHGGEKSGVSHLYDESFAVLRVILVPMNRTHSPFLGIPSSPQHAPLSLVLKGRRNYAQRRSLTPFKSIFAPYSHRVSYVPKRKMIRWRIPREV